MLEIKIGTADFRDRGDELEHEEKMKELADVLCKAESIMNDEPLYRAVKAYMARKQKKYSSIADLRGALTSKEKAPKKETLWEIFDEEDDSEDE